ncbi:LytR/AlgR family response regulator transcription factor [Owenweeksia hongkongensis]|uniref:LytR/AlgR family response regulator transcription factor n=1 Tax=Owenweeksia hongkongensis TaxID=253245 RepID=UPI003A8FFBE9
MKKIKALLIDDEPLACDLVQEYLQDYGEVEIVGRCHDGFEGLKAINEHQPDLVFLDVQMPKISGFEMLELLDEPPAVIFATAFDEYAIKAFEQNAVDYLLKPFSKERFDKALQKFLVRQGALPENVKKVVEEAVQTTDQNRVVIKDGAKIRIIPVKDIIRLEADDDYVKIFTAQGNFMKKKTLTHFEKTLTQDIFVRVHRSHLLNISHILRIDPYEKNSHVALLKDNTRVPVSRSGYQVLKGVLNL